MGEVICCKTFVPLDGSIEFERVINSIQDVLDLQSAVILLKVIPPMSGQKLGEVLIPLVNEKSPNGLMRRVTRGL